MSSHLYNSLNQAIKPKYQLSHADKQILARQAARLLKIQTQIELAAIKIDEALDILKDK